MTEESSGWSEEASDLFLTLGNVFTPDREQIAEVILDLVPAERDEPFLAVDLATGSGWLSAAVLDRFPAARVLALDPSPAMRRAATETLAPFGDRVGFDSFLLEDTSWTSRLPEPPRAVLSSLTVHHLERAGKRALYRAVAAALAPAGTLLIADLVAPTSERQRRQMARSWDETVRERSQRLTGSLAAHDRFRTLEWNWFDHPDPFDRPSTIPEHLAWLTEAGFIGVNLFWQHAGHAVYGGYRAP